MRLRTYDIEMDASGTVFSFVSEGPQGKIPKLIKYSKMGKGRIYNLGFGDIDARSGAIDDLSRTDNQDTDIVLATVVQTVLAFTTLYPGSLIYAKGSTPARTRLYQMGIARFLEDITRDFEVFGLIGDTWEEFERGRRYEAFIAERRPAYGEKAKEGGKNE